MYKTNWFLSTNKHEIEPKRGTKTLILLKRTEFYQAAAATVRGYNKYLEILKRLPMTIPGPP